MHLLIAVSQDMFQVSCGMCRDLIPSFNVHAAAGARTLKKPQSFWMLFSDLDKKHLKDYFMLI